MKNCTAIFMITCVMLNLSLRAQDAVKPLNKENLYLHFDKYNYFIGESIRFKAYLVSGSDDLLKDSSTITYVELIDEHRQLLKRIALNTLMGMAVGDIALDAGYQPGKYYIRAYTNWMRNFGDSLFFRKEFNVYNKMADWLVQNSTVKMSKENNGVHADMSMKLTAPDMLSLFNKRTNAFVYSGNKLVAKDQVELTDGNIRLNFTLSDKQAKETVQVKLGNEEDSIQSSYTLPALSNADVQFLPESGHLLAGFDNTVAIKAIGTDGYGVDIAGDIFNQQNEMVTSFQTLYKGMGIVQLMPQAGEVYTAVLRDGRRISLPLVETNGTLLQVQPAAQKRIKINIINTRADTRDFILRFSFKGEAIHTIEKQVNGQATAIFLEKQALPTGIVTARLLLKNGNILNERAFFVNNDDQLHLQLDVQPDPVHADSALLVLKAAGPDEKPVFGTFSLSVTDNKMEQKPVYNSNIISYLLLESGLRGTVEEPGYYFSSAAAKTGMALDAVMLTHGFVKYDWAPRAFKFEEEKEFTVKGRITNALLKGAPGRKMALYGRGLDSTYIRNYAVSDNKGYFLFKHIPAFDTTVLTIREQVAAVIKNEGGRSVLDLEPKTKWGVNITIEKPVYPGAGSLVLATDRLATEQPFLTGNLRNVYDYKLLLKEKGMLEEVFVNAGKKVIRSKNVNGPGRADEVFTEKDLTQYAGKNVYDIIRKRIPGLTLLPDRWTLADPKTGKPIANKVKVIIDGMDLDQLDKMYLMTESQSSSDSLYRWKYEYVLSLLKTEEILGIEVMHSYRYAISYFNRYGGTGPDAPISAAFNNLAYIEITTKNGRGIYYKLENAKEAICPVPFYYGKTEYTPLYVDTKTGLKNMEATLYWNANLLTGADGAFTHKIYLPQNMKDYTIWLEGVDANGRPGIKVITGKQLQDKGKLYSYSSSKENLN